MPGSGTQEKDGCRAPLDVCVTCTREREGQLTSCQGELPAETPRYRTSSCRTPSC